MTQVLGHPVYDTHCHYRVSPSAVRVSCFLHFSNFFVPTHCRCRELLLYLVTLSDTHTHARTHTLVRTSLDEWAARRRDLYLTTRKTDKRQISMSPSGFEPGFPASERPPTHALDRAATGIGHVFLLVPDVGLICSDTDTSSEEQLLRFFQLGSMSFGCHLFFIWTLSLGY